MTYSCMTTAIAETKRKTGSKLVYKDKPYGSYASRRDGVLYVGWYAVHLDPILTPASSSVLLMLNVVLLILLQLSPVNAILSGGDQLSTLMAPLSSILVSHFMLDLQEAYQRMNIGLVSGDPMHTSRTTSSPTLIFAPALGSLAARIDAPFVDPLDTDWDQGTSEDVQTEALAKSDEMPPLFGVMVSETPWSQTHLPAPCNAGTSHNALGDNAG
ncbi:hypothetical protein BD309DRAFT_983782 [Dichomitus squalens]|uniref:Uncharacterized protein n=1 Tax=Dichomitus squalens TaxID=114155 RepID=A0A4Q9PHL4_9APHY|nr:hypothetical protein BD309DRAFT_983782 [Dichomitus squalens]TBU53317.1 hypothetical protein BD310DRAFT_909553 [Dichomitus squalens]